MITQCRNHHFDYQINQRQTVINRKEAGECPLTLPNKSVTERGQSLMFKHSFPLIWVVTPKVRKKNEDYPLISVRPGAKSKHESVQRTSQSAELVFFSFVFAERSNSWQHRWQSIWVVWCFLWNSIWRINTAYCQQSAASRLTIDNGTFFALRRLLQSTTLNTKTLLVK